MNDVAAWGVIAGMAGYGFAVLGLAGLAVRRRARAEGAAPVAAPARPAPVVDPGAAPAAG
ncbi:hypothetical protein SAMN04488543_1316 [Friedmanniella luteola]|uniref:Heme exporter protein D n=1 Tax=Friedmanniella luteola TaxID=546871 RepID=A0A1H1QGI3_9ACTN|nr:hypothetical protein [Friedmanniella luteola]SDS22535.1 hypothetical protein SAMN04488543_1316 [Friedmanniella luteola]